MTFKEAFEAMKHGAKVKLPSWAGYWFWCIPAQSILMHTKDGKDIDVRSTECPDYTFTNICSDEWIFANDTNCPALGGEATFSFSEAIKQLKKGRKVARKGWNGKKQYIQLATGISYKTADGEIVNCEHYAIGNIVSAQEKRMERHIAVAAEVCSRNRRTNHDYHRNGSLSECM